MYDVRRRSLCVTTVEVEDQLVLNILKWVFVLSLVIWHANHIPLRRGICGPSASAIFYNVYKKHTIFGKHSLKNVCVICNVRKEDFLLLEELSDV
jgi:hypothetical protein